MTKQRLTKNIDLSSIDLNDKKALDKVTKAIVAKMKKENKTLQEVVGVDPSFLEKLYAAGYTHYNAGSYSEALDIFEFLAKVSPYTHKYVLGCAASLYQMKFFGIAAFLFYSALHLEPENAYTAYYLSDSLLKNGHIQEGKEALAMTMEIASLNDEYAHIKERCRLLREEL